MERDLGAARDGQSREEEKKLGRAANLPGLAFYPDLHVSPYELFRQLREGRPPRLWALPEIGEQSLEGALPYPAAASSTGHAALDLVPGDQAVLLDRDGEAALAEVRRLHATHPAPAGRVRALYGGLELYDHCLDPKIVGEDRYLLATGQAARRR